MLRESDLVSIQEVRAKVEQAYAAFQQFRTFKQEQLDAIVEAMAAAARAKAAHLAQRAVEETSYGNTPDKTAKNLLTCDILPRTLRGMKTVGILREDTEKKVIEIGVPVGVVAAILPTTNPTSTAIYKTIIALKAGNAVVLSPHPRARACSCETARVLYEAARAAGAPEHIIQCIDNATMEGTDALMRHPRTSVIVATGGAGIVKAAYSSGKPAYGVGPGNVPVLLDASANIGEAVAKVLQGKSFDYGTLCSSEQTLVALEASKQAVMEELKRQQAYLCNETECRAVAKLLIAPNWRINANCVGQAAPKIAQMAGFAVPPETRVLVTPIGGVGKEYPLSMEKLSPVLSLLFVADWEAQVRACQALLKFGGLGHTSVIHTTDPARVREYGLRIPSFRVLVNTPSPHGSTGITTALAPAMTLGCGAMAGNATSDNLGPQHLMNVRRVATMIRKPEEAFETAPSGDVPQMMLSAVDKYLARRGIGGIGGVGAACPAPSVAATVVDRFLGQRGGAAEAPASSCGCPAPTPAPALETPAPSPAPAAEPVKVTDFVCEADVRDAMRAGKKIFTGPRTIITPAARELAAQHDILVTAQRP
ncbi:MAG: aldehyde dehydrogenase family protein [Acidobacteria bacterium]|nr:aldehyde dehydrogenase family protein [Acidobacteriota bacterium]